MAGRGAEGRNGNLARVLEATRNDPLKKPAPSVRLFDGLMKGTKLPRRRSLPLSHSSRRRAHPAAHSRAQERHGVGERQAGGGAEPRSGRSPEHHPDLYFHQGTGARQGHTDFLGNNWRFASPIGTFWAALPNEKWHFKPLVAILSDAERHVSRTVEGLDREGSRCLGLRLVLSSDSTICAVLCHSLLDGTRVIALALCADRPLHLAGYQRLLIDGLAHASGGVASSGRVTRDHRNGKLSCCIG